MSTKALMRATDHSIIKQKLSGDENSQEDSPIKVDITAGYRALMRDNTLAGRHASRAFRNGEKEESSSRLRMVSRLRQKESWLIWRDIVRDLDRSFGSLLQRISPSMWLKEGKPSYR